MSDKSSDKSTTDRMATLRDQLVDLFLKEADPASWPGTDTMQERGDRVWAKKSAEATGRLAMRAAELVAMTSVIGNRFRGVQADEDLQREVEQAQRDAEELQRGVQRAQRDAERLLLRCGVPMQRGSKS